MRFKDYKSVSVQSIQRDFQRYGKRNEKERTQPCAEPQNNSVRRVQLVGENSIYYKNRHLIVGRLVRVVEKGAFGGYVCEFVHEEDRKALNQANDWSDSKQQYLFDNIKFK